LERKATPKKQVNPIKKQDNLMVPTVIPETKGPVENGQRMLYISWIIF
jgi:hypothetical protein